MISVQQSSVGFSCSTLKIILVFSLFSFCLANSKYNRLNSLQRSLNGPIVISSPNERIQYGDEPEYTLTSNYYKRDGVRRCGMVLLRYIQKLCNGCVDRPKSSEESNRVKRSYDPFLEGENLTDLCCKKSCDDSQLAELCC